MENNSENSSNDVFTFSNSNSISSSSEELSDYDEDKIFNEDLDSKEINGGNGNIIFNAMAKDILINQGNHYILINSYIDNLIPKIIENIININIEKIIEKINEEFIILNARYNNDLQVNMRLVEILKIKFEKFFKPKIQEELYKIFLEKASLIFIKITKIFIGEKISEKIEDKEINELADSNINNLLQKINIEYESDS